MLSRNKIIEKLVNEGFTYKTLSLFNDRQIKELASRILREATTSRVEKTTYTKSEVDKMKQQHGGLAVDGTVTPNEDGSVTVTQELGEDNIDDDKEFEKTHPKTKKIDTEAGELDLVLGEMDLDDRHPNRKGSGNGKNKTDGSTFEPVNYDVTKPKSHDELSRKKELTHTGEGYIHEEFKSKDQQQYFFAKCDEEGPKSKWCKMAKEFADDTKDFSKLPEKVQNEMVEEWVTSLVEREDKTIKVSKGKLMEMVRQNYKLNYDTGKIKRMKKTMDLFDSMEQEIAFDQLNRWTLQKKGFQLNVDELEKGEDSEESVLLLYLNSASGDVWDIKIYTDGNIYMDDAPINDIQDFEEEIKEKESKSEGELAETERDTEGAYMGAPVKEPTIKPTTTPTPTKKPGRPGPFKRPQTTPKPKAQDKKVPDWFNFDKIKSQVEKK